MPETHAVASELSESLERLFQGPEGGRLVKQIVLRLLTRFLESKNRTLDVNEGSGFDAVAPSGIDPDIPGPTIVDITHNLKRVQGQRFASDLRKAIDGSGARSVLLIASHVLRPDRMALLQANARFHDVTLAFWGPEKLAELVDAFPDAVGGLLPNVGPKAVAKIVENADNDWLQRRKQHISDLSRVYLSDRLSLFLGAGVSVDCGIPTWKRLITSLALAVVDEQTPKGDGSLPRDMNSEERSLLAAALVSSQEGSPLLVGRYLETSLGPTFTPRVHAELYRATKQITEASLVSAIARLCRPTRRREGIFAVVTYNYDDLLEMTLEQSEVKCRAIFQKGVHPDPDELPIYHVHGRLPQSSSNDNDSKLVFSEESYLALQSEHYHWANFEQLKLLRDTTCLLLGLSGTDPNLRRLLDIDFGQSKRAKHYICLKRQTALDLLGEKKSLVRSAVAEHFLNVHHSLLEHSFADLGLNVIWLTDHGELAGILRNIRTNQAP